MKLGNGRVVTPAGVCAPGWVDVEDGNIAAVGTGETRPDSGVDLAGRWLVPGFVDIHVHGGGGSTFDGGDSEDVARVVATHRAHGTTSMLASLATAPLDTMVTALRALTELTREGLVVGIHLEGPFLSPARCGAHAPSLLRPPRTEEVDILLSAGRGAVRMVTLSPELDGGLDAVRRVVGAGAVAAIGHTDADYETTVAAIDAGATVATHLHNGMPPMHHRAPGPVGALLEDPRVTVELINDGVHLHDAVVALTVAAAGAERVILVTDAMAAAGSRDGEYRLAGRRVIVRDGVARLSDGESIAGSTLTADVAFRRAVRQGMGMGEAVSLASTTPARLLGLAGTTGAIRSGLRADLVVLDGRLQVEAVMHGGRWLDGPPARVVQEAGR